MIAYTKRDPMVTPKEAGITILMNKLKTDSGEITAPFSMIKLVPIIIKVEGIGAMISSIILPIKTPKGP